MADETRKSEEERLRAHREADAKGGVVDVPKPRHGDPTEGQPAGLGGSVIGVRVGSEAAVESGTGPVLPAPGAPLGELTRVRNKELRDRDEKEFRKRGLNPDGTGSVGTAISMNFEGPVMIERSEADGGNTVVSGSFTGVLPAGGLKVRKLSSDEEQEYFSAGAPQGVRSTSRTR